MSIPTSMPAAGGAKDSPGMAKLGPSTSSPPAGYVYFQYNPATITIGHTSPMESSTGDTTKGGKGGKDGHGDGDGGGSRVVSTSVEELLKAHGVTTINIRGVTFDGAKVAETCATLHDWSQFEAPKSPNSNAQTQKHVLPVLKFIWGPALTYLVTLTQVTINYTRFGQQGLPVRATVDLTMNLKATTLKPTNPSSGGVPGRRTHTLTGAETLPELATRTYGRPDRWREIAAANGFGDPLRVRPGTVVYLPAAQESGQ